MRKKYAEEKKELEDAERTLSRKTALSRRRFDLGLHITWGVDEIYPRFFKKLWEIMKIHDFPSIFNENYEKSMKKHGFSDDFYNFS